MQLARGRVAGVEVDRGALPTTWRGLAPTYALGVAAMLAACLFAVSWGTEHIALSTTLSVLFDHLPWVDTHAHTATQDAIVWDIRAPRVVLAAIVGATLAFSGAAYQAVFRNPLAEPYLIGVAAGASVGATLIIVSPFLVVAGVFSTVPPAAFAGALIAVALSYNLARVGRRVPTESLILSGVAISSLGTSLVTYLMLAYTERTLSILNWVLGGFNTASWVQSGIALPYALVAAVVIMLHARVLNVLQTDDEQARQLGVRVERTRLLVLAMASLATAAAVSVSGLIGFVGLVVPHAVRLVWGADYRRILPLAACFGGAFLVLADVAARSIDPGREVPISVVTAIVGAPFFLYLLRRRNRFTYEGA